jgi:hypothetical protein
MNDHFTVVESRMQSDGSVRHLVQAPGGTIVVHEDPSGNLSARFRSGYVATDEAEEDRSAAPLKLYASFIEIPVWNSRSANRLNEIYRMQFVSEQENHFRVS